MGVEGGCQAGEQRGLAGAPLVGPPGTRKLLAHIPGQVGEHHFRLNQRLSLTHILSMTHVQQRETARMSR